MEKIYSVEENYLEESKPVAQNTLESLKTTIWSIQLCSSHSCPQYTPYSEWLPLSTKSYNRDELDLGIANLKGSGHEAKGWGEE